uniref:Uncharacterized protein n=1 Tax=Anguilla anguilla TaxID=7936 RepID=A0A0E9R034_ANGAN
MTVELDDYFHALKKLNNYFIISTISSYLQGNTIFFRTYAD